MANDELEKLLADDGTTPEAPAAGTEKSQEQEKVDAELEAKEKRNRELEEQNAQLEKAKAEALAELSRIRKEKRQAKQGQPLEEEDIPKINYEDPSARAWKREISNEVDPVRSELEREKAEVLDISLKRFLKDKPALAKDSVKIKELMDAYEALSSGKITGKNADVVGEYLSRAYAATNHESLFQQQQNKRRQQAMEDEMFSGAAVDSGTGSYVSAAEEEVQQKLSSEQLDILRKWCPPDTPFKQYVKEYLADKKKHGQ